MIDYGLKDKVAIITGANNPWGIGATTALALAREGAKVVLVYKKILREFDEKVAAFCAAWQITYTRYCDDLAFSGDFEPEPVVDFVKQALAEEGFRLNWKKVRFSTAGCRQQVTGLVVNRGVRTPAEYRAKLRQQLYYLEKYGTASCLERMAPAETEEAYLARLSGQVSYALCADPADAELQKAGALLRKLLAEARLQA